MLVPGGPDPRAVAAPSLRGRRFTLVPLSPDLHRPLYALNVSNQISYRWRFHGHIPPFENFERNLHQGVLVQFGIVPTREPNKLVGHVAAYDANLQDGTAYLAAVSRPDLVTGMMEGVVLFLRYVFAHWQLRKIYLEVPDFNLYQFESGVRDGLLKEEGRLVAHQYFDNQYWDLHVLAVYREDARAWRERFKTLVIPENPVFVVDDVEGPADGGAEEQAGR